MRWGGSTEAEYSLEATAIMQGREIDDLSQGDSRSREQRLEAVIFEGNSEGNCPRTGCGV